MIVNVVTTQCNSEDERRFNHWYNTVHVPMLLKFKRLKLAVRYKVLTDPGPTLQYVAVYHFATKKAFESLGASKELSAAVKELGDNWGSRVKIVSIASWEQLKAWEE